MDKEINLKYLGCHWYEGNDSYVYVYLDEERGFFIYTKEENPDLENVFVFNKDTVSYMCGVSVDSINLQEDDNIIDFGYFIK